MDTKKLEKHMSYAIKVLFITLGLVLLLALVSVEATKKPDEEIQRILAEMQSQRTQSDELPPSWPPRMNETYPDMELVDQEGIAFSLSDLRGRVILLEFVDMNSPWSQSSAGAEVKGVYGAPPFSPDPYVSPPELFVPKYSEGAVTLPEKDLVVVSILVKNMKGDAAGLDDAKAWAQHFGLTKDNMRIVAFSPKDLRSRETDTMMTGYQLIDKKFNLRVDAAGANPKHNLNMTLVPLISKLL